MGFFVGKLLTFLLCVSLFEGWMVQSIPYDYTASIECLSNPMRPLYKGGIIQNGEFDNGLMGWTLPWGVNATVSRSPSGNKFAVAKSTGAWGSKSVLQKIQMQTNTHYALSAWLQVSSGTAEVKATVRAPNGALLAAGATVVKSGCWTMFKGGMTAYSSGSAEVFFEADAPLEIWLDSVSMQPFSFAEWKAQRGLATDKARKSAVKVIARGAGGKALANATVKVDLLRQGFPFGNAMTKEILRNPAYEKWFASRFTVATLENEMRWNSTETAQNQEDYRVPDAMLRLAQKHNIKVRGHDVFWNEPNSQAKWLQPLSVDQLKVAMRKRLKSVVARYSGKVVAWDVVNENVHWDFFESKLGPNASAVLFRQVAQIDRAATLFLNEFGTLEEPIDAAAMPSKYVAKVNQIRSYPGNAGVRLGVGLEGHFSTPNIPYMRATLDTLAQLRLPVWLTEVDVAQSPYQAKYLEEVLREGYGHPAVQGMVMWANWHAGGCSAMCLTDNGFKNLPAGDVVDRLIVEWKKHPVAARTDANGAVELDLVSGNYRFTVTHPTLKSPAVRTSAVEASSSPLERTIEIKA